MKRITTGAWCLTALLCAGCTSYHETSLHQIEAHPDELIDKKVRVHYATPGITAPDSLVALRVAEVHYPVLRGETYFDPKLYSSPAPTRPLEATLTGSYRVEVKTFDPAKTALLLAGAVVIGFGIYAALQAMGEAMGDEFFHWLSGNGHSQRAVSTGPPGR